MAQTLRLSRKCLLQTHDRLIERQKTRYTWIPFQEYDITDFNEFFFISLLLLKLSADVYAPVHD